ncbi:MAG TPA: Trx7/PDZ domain-containing (seleno)protein [Gemmataceae bacterium]|jgi:thiol-disulfide isomerase/thioredoxin|nr:Trx7/PDZ domain-containing (seleno)protein [Gemmataceae bacterium]
MRTALIVSLALVAPAFAQRADPRANGWHTDYTSAKAEAKRTGKPLFVVFRCDPCGDCVHFDGQVVKLAKPLDEIANQFVCVRLLRITGIDLTLFDFDFDCTWYGFFLSADETIYGRYGGRDGKSDTGRLSLPGLKYAMQKALDRHKAGSAKTVERAKPIRAEDFASAKKRRGNECIHCHLVNEFRRADAKAAGTWNRDDRWFYPLPENVGLALNTDRADIVKAVLDNSPAAKLGIKAGDTLVTLNGLPVASNADVQYALNNGPKSGKIPIEWKRSTDQMAGDLQVVDGWRKTNLSWRPSLFDILPMLPVSAEDLTADEKKKLGIPEAQAAFRQDKYVHSTLKAIGMKAGDVIVRLDGKTVEGSMDDFLAMVRREHLVGDSAELTVLRDGKAVELKITLK